MPAVGPRPLRIGIGKQAADVTQAGRAKQGIGDRVQQHIGVRMTEQPLMVRNLDAAENQFATGRKGMHVESLADTKIHCHITNRERKIDSASRRSPG
jgi:hypothetical protein